MNALYLSYSTLALAYFIIGKKYNTSWLQQGNYLFLALVTTVMLITNGFDFAIAYFVGYFDAMVGFYIEKLGNGYVMQWIGLMILPAFGIINFFRKIRKHGPTQLVLWCLVTLTLLLAVYQQQNLDVFLPFYPQQTTNEPGWHTYMPSALSWIEIAMVLGIGFVTTMVLGGWLRRRTESKLKY